MEHYEVLNSAGKPIVLTPQEQRIADVNQQLVNDLGYEIPITTLTALSKRVVEQKFYEIRPSDYIPVAVGNGAWATEILTYTSFSTGGDFEQGNLNTGSNNTRIAEADTGISGIRNEIVNWGKQISYSIMDLKTAARAGNWDLVTSKEKARKTNWDLGIQRTAFLGSKSITGVKGLLTQDNVTANTAIITEYLSNMTATELNAVLGTIYQAYRLNSEYTAKPTHFVIPEADYNGLASQMSEEFPIKTKLQVLLEMFIIITDNPNFKIKPLSYANQAVNADVAGLNKNRYTLYNYNEDSMRMDIPVDYTNTLANSINNFQFQNVGYGQYTGLLAYRPKEMIYFDWAA